MSRDEIADRPTEIQIESQERPYDGFRPVDTYRFRHRLAGTGDWERAARRQLLRSPPIVAVLPYDPEAGHIVLLRQFRLGAHLATGSGMLVEIVAGGVDEGEEPEAAAARELGEETNLEPLSLTAIARFLSSPGVSDECISLYAARVDIRHLPRRTGHDEDEIIYPFACTPAEAIAAADRGAIGNVFTLLALNWLDRHKDSLFGRRQEGSQ